MTIHLDLHYWVEKFLDCQTIDELLHLYSIAPNEEIILNLIGKQIQIISNQEPMWFRNGKNWERVLYYKKVGFGDESRTYSSDPIHFNLYTGITWHMTTFNKKWLYESYDHKYPK